MIIVAGIIIIVIVIIFICADFAMATDHGPNQVTCRCIIHNRCTDCMDLLHFHWMIVSSFRVGKFSIFVVVLMEVFTYRTLGNTTNRGISSSRFHTNFAPELIKLS